MLNIFFEFEVKDGEWHHKSESSKGNPIHEIWSLYKEAFQKEWKFRTQ